MFVFTREYLHTLRITGGVINTGDLCPAYCCRMMSRTKWNWGAVTETREVESRRKKGIADERRGKKRPVLRGFAGSPFLQSSFSRRRWCHSYGCSNHLRGFKMAAGFRDWAVVFVEVFSSFLRAGAESRSARDLSLWIITVKGEIGNDLACVKSASMRCKLRKWPQVAHKTVSPWYYTLKYSLCPYFMYLFHAKIRVFSHSHMNLHLLVKIWEQTKDSKYVS